MARKPATLREYVRKTFSCLAIAYMASGDDPRAVRDVATPDQIAEMYNGYQAELWELAIAAARKGGHPDIWDWFDSAAPKPPEDFDDVRTSLVDLALPWLAEDLDVEWAQVQELEHRLTQAEQHLEGLKRRPPHPSEAKRPMDVTGRCRRAARQLGRCRKALYRWYAPKGGPADVQRARDTLAAGERELELADRLIAKLAGKVADIR